MSANLRALAGVGLSTAVLWLAALRRRPIPASRRPILPLPPALCDAVSFLLRPCFCVAFLFFGGLPCLVMVVVAVVVVDGGGGGGWLMMGVVVVVDGSVVWWCLLLLCGGGCGGGGGGGGFLWWGVWWVVWWGGWF